MTISPASSTRLTSAGNIKSSPGILKCVEVSNPTTTPGNASFVNATSGTGVYIFDVYVGAQDSKYLVFPSDFGFSTGIRVGTLGTGLIVTGVYI